MTARKGIILAGGSITLHPDKSAAAIVGAFGRLGFTAEQGAYGIDPAEYFL